MFYFSVYSMPNLKHKHQCLTKKAVTYIQRLELANPLKYWYLFSIVISTFMSLMIKVKNLYPSILYGITFPVCPYQYIISSMMLSFTPFKWISKQLKNNNVWILLAIVNA